MHRANKKRKENFGRKISRNEISWQTLNTNMKIILKQIIIITSSTAPITFVLIAGIKTVPSFCQTLMSYERVASGVGRFSGILSKH